jgi:hypothetical protein
VSQTRFQSGVEVVLSTALAFTLSVYAGQYVIYPAFNMHPTMAVNMGSTAAFTVVSIVRSYITRRFFNWLHTRQT